MKSKDKILVIGASGQIGTELILKLRSIYGGNSVIAADIKTPAYDVLEGGPYEILDVLDTKRLGVTINKHKVTHVYLLAALLSATSEHNPEFGWRLNMQSLLNVLSLAKEKTITKVFWPSSIAVFGPTSPKKLCPQYTITEPATVYGISKLAGERWCEYYYQKFKVDVRSLRYPGLISYHSQPGGGTTDYAVHIFYEALNKSRYKCFLSAGTALPMMYMPDAIRATIELMDAPSNKVSIRSSYNISSESFSPSQLAEEIKKHLPAFKISYSPDYRQAFAETWPGSIDDSCARLDWGWKHRYDLRRMTTDMLKHLKKG